MRVGSFMSGAMNVWSPRAFASGATILALSSAAFIWTGGCLPDFGALVSGETGGGSSSTSASSSSSSTSSTSASSSASSSSSTSSSGQPIAAMNVIDDFDTGTCALPSINGRAGGWYKFDDGTQTPDGGTDPLSLLCNAPVSGGAPGSTMALELVSPVGFPGYAGAGVDLNNNGSVRAPYDLTPYHGVAFWAKGNSALDFRFVIVDNSQWGTQVSVTEDWQQYTIPLSDLALMNSASEAGTFPPSEVMTLQFGILSKGPFDVYIEDIGLY